MNTKKLLSLHFFSFFIKVIAILGIITLLIFSTISLVEIAKLNNEFRLIGQYDYSYGDFAFANDYFLHYFAQFKFSVFGSYHYNQYTSINFFEPYLLSHYLVVAKYGIELLLCLTLCLFAHRITKEKYNSKITISLLIMSGILIALIPISTIIFEYIIYLKMSNLLNIPGQFVPTIDYLYFVIAFVIIYFALIYGKKKHYQVINLIFKSILGGALLGGLVLLTLNIKSMIDANNIKYLSFFELAYNKTNIFDFLMLHNFNVGGEYYWRIPNDTNMHPLFVWQNFPALFASLMLLIVIGILIYSITKKHKSKINPLLILLILLILIPFLYMIVDQIIMQIAWYTILDKKSCLQETCIAIDIKSDRPFLPVNYDYFIFSLFLFIGYLIDNETNHFLITKE